MENWWKPKNFPFFYEQAWKWIQSLTASQVYLFWLWYFQDHSKISSLLYYSVLTRVSFSIKALRSYFQVQYTCISKESRIYYNPVNFLPTYYFLNLKNNWQSSHVNLMPRKNKIPILTSFDRVSKNNKSSFFDKNLKPVSYNLQWIALVCKRIMQNTCAKTVASALSKAVQDSTWCRDT